MAFQPWCHIDPETAVEKCKIANALIERTSNEKWDEQVLRRRSRLFP